MSELPDIAEPDDLLPIIHGIQMTRGGQVFIDPKLEDLLCELAIDLQGPEELPVDVEHVVAALILASRKREIPNDYALHPRDRTLRKLLWPHVKMIFQRYGGEICEEE